MILDGFSFFQNCCKHDRVYWLCSQNRKMKCNARIITSLNFDTIRKKRLCHNHMPDDAKSKDDESIQI
jgi:hypothetical protein